MSEKSRGRGVAATIKACVMLIGILGASCAAAGESAAVGSIQLSGHVLPALTKAALIAKGAKRDDFATQAMTLTIVLRRSDPEGFGRYLAALDDRQSSDYKRFLSPQEVSSRFGPSESDYTAVQNYFAQQGFTLGDGSSNRMTLTVTAPRPTVEKALSLKINDYKAAQREFFANASEPSLPAAIAQRVEAIAGLSNLAEIARPNLNYYNTTNCVKDDFICEFNKSAAANAYNLLCFTPVLAQLTWVGSLIVAIFNRIFQGIWAFDVCPKKLGSTAVAQSLRLGTAGGAKAGSALAVPNDLDGTGQSIGLVEFDSFLQSDVADYFALVQAPSTILTQLSSVQINGGAALGPNQSEVLLDIDTALSMAPKARVVVYSAPNAGGGSSYQAIFNRMITDGMTVISNSWSYCEDQTTLADVQSIDTILATAAASGISVFNGSGDTGSTCLDGSANTAGVPATSPHATAVGGTSIVFGPGGTYGSETWWDGSSSTPPTGQGGFGVSRFFARPSYQNGLTASPTRSIPDIAIRADPAQGVSICQASGGGCPTGLFYGGTSFAAPQMAALAALFNQARGVNMGLYNTAIYPLANTAAFHSAASMGSDFAHVGLGSPNFGLLNQRLNGITPGLPDKDVSKVGVLGNVTWIVPEIRKPLSADGTTLTQVVVQLRDIDGNTVSGKTVTLAANAGSHAVISPANGVTSVANGSFVFNVTDATIEDVTFSATDVTDGIVLSMTDSASYVSPPAASASISASPSTVPPDQTSTATITVTLKDVHNNPSPGKVVTIAQGSGHSVIVAPSASVTNASGQIQFLATNGVSEVVAYTAVDVTDGNLPVPGSATVNFTGTATSCVAAPPVAAPGFAVSSFSTGYFAQNFFFGNVNWGGCPGASNPTFSPDQSVYAANFRTGDLFKFGLTGGAVSNANKISNLNQTLGQVTFGKDGRLYATHGATTGDFTTGNIVEIDPTTGAQLRVVASNLTCPNGLSVDPLSGDLFFDDQCFGAGSNNPSLWRIHDPAGAAMLSVYATLPGSPNGAITFSPDGAIYVVTNYLDPAPQITRVSGTNTPSPPTMGAVANLSSFYWVTMGQAQSNGAAKSLIILDSSGVELVDITTTPYTKTLLISGQGVGSGVIGPDGCLYTTEGDTIYKLTTSAGTCGFVPTNPGPALSLAPAVVSPDPAQGGAQTLTATFKNTTVPAGTPVTFTVRGPNSQQKLARTDANGAATVSYTGVTTGTDTVTATGIAGASTLTSNVVNVTWNAAKHVSLMALNTAPSSGVAGAPVTLVAALADVSQTPNGAIVGVTIQFSLGGQTCSGVTNAQGIASCIVTAPSGQSTLTATFAGNSQYTASTASQGFSTVSAAGPTVPGAPTNVTATAGNGFIAVAFAPPASDGGSPIISYNATCTSVTPGSSASGTNTASPVPVLNVTNGVTYTCTVSALNAAGVGAASTPSNPATPAGAPAAAQPIPTLDRGGGIVLALLLTLMAAIALRRRQRRR